jgi:hypothetical protein
MSILTLTKDPLTVVLGFLNIKELGRMALVNHSIRDVEEDDRVWNEVLRTLIHNINNDINPQLGTASLFDEDLEIAHLTRKIFVRILVSDHLLYPREEFIYQLGGMALCTDFPNMQKKRDVALAKIKKCMEKNDVFNAEWLCKHFGNQHGKLNFIQRTITIVNESHHDYVVNLAMKHSYMSNDSFTTFLDCRNKKSVSLKDYKGNITSFGLCDPKVHEYMRPNFSRLTYFHIECGSKEYAATAARILDKCRPQHEKSCDQTANESGMTH